MGSQMKGVKVGICCELAVGRQTSGLGSNAGKSSVEAWTRLDDAGFNKIGVLLTGNKEESGGSRNESDEKVGNSGRAAEVCKMDVLGGHQE